MPGSSKKDFFRFAFGFVAVLSFGFVTLLGIGFFQVEIAGNKNISSAESK